MTSSSPVSQSAMQKPMTSLSDVSHNHPLVELSSHVATLCGVISRARSSSIVSAFSRVSGLIQNRAGMSAGVIGRMLMFGKGGLRGLTFELSGRRRRDASPGPVKMYRVPPVGPWQPAVGAPLERGVSEVIGPLPQIAPKKLWAPVLWQGGTWRCARPM